MMAKPSFWNCQKCRRAPSVPKSSKMENFGRNNSLAQNVRKNIELPTHSSSDNQTSSSFHSNSKSRSRSDRSYLMNSSAYNSFISNNPSPVISSLVGRSSDMRKEASVDYGLCRNCSQRYPLPQCPGPTAQQDAWHSQRYSGSGDSPSNISPRYNRVDSRYEIPQNNTKYDRSDSRNINTWQSQMLPPDKQHYVPPDKQHYVQPDKQHYVQPDKQHYIQPDKQHYVQPDKQHYVQPDKQHYVQPERQFYDPTSDKAYSKQPHRPPVRETHIPEVRETLTPIELTPMHKKRILSENNRIHPSDVKRQKITETSSLCDMMQPGFDTRQPCDINMDNALIDQKINDKEKKAKSKFKKKRNSGGYCTIS